MSELTVEQYEELPEFLKKNYVQDGEGFSHAGMMKVKSTADNLDKQSKDALRKLEEYQRDEAEKIRIAENKAYEKAKAEGNIEGVESRLTQKLQDAERRNEETEKQFKIRMQKLADKQKSALAAELASKYCVKGGNEAYKMLVSRYIEVDPETDEVTFLDDSGRATSLKQADFETSLKNNVFLQPLTKADISTTGGGKVNGEGNGGRASNLKFNEMSGAQLSALRKEDPQAYDRLKTEYYN